jgi:hypothetical protein
VIYDPAEVTFAKLLDVFWDKHDPTQLNRQGGDTSTQYRSGGWLGAGAARHTGRRGGAVGAAQTGYQAGWQPQAHQLKLLRSPPAAGGYLQPVLAAAAALPARRSAST